ncbi:MAG: spore coat protein CotJB [Clostridia bacterium]|nr:spore coat protein CotJB [Clostridia bacterium]MBR0026487.1 spore coat protein CotJB [Clostridia bacterium]
MELTQNALLSKISEAQFVCVELNLYLDTHPNDEDARADYLCYSETLKQLIEKYEALYGPLKNFGLSPTETGCWVSGKWPWEL